MDTVNVNEHESKSEKQQGPDAEFISKDDVWARMARTLLDEDGSRVLPQSMRAEVENGLAMVYWTEAHYVSEARYDEFVASVRAQATNEGE